MVVPRCPGEVRWGGVGRGREQAAGRGDRAFWRGLQELGKGQRAESGPGPGSAPLPGLLSPGAAPVLPGPSAPQKPGSISRNLHRGGRMRGSVKPHAWEMAVDCWRAACQERPWGHWGTPR